MSVTWRYTPPKINAALVLKAAIPVATHAAAEHLLEVAKPLVPYDPSVTDEKHEHLRDSGKVVQDGEDAQVSFDALSPDGYAYGVRQHEDMTLHHPNGGQAKFLETPMDTERQAVAAIMATTAREALGL